ncbi:helix-turn-helix domain-containing protein [Chlorogloea sp. CCALA 695]|uniref:helix-turn-helix domain-containing protein n=1 Tax=Chlorogloea sp. CCALA 695 TaxID=2107693 RepID=UPI000D05D8EA|nr:helix-turn-helix domain-containing protein [Chlorogloea sp. CCALA 695]PSB27687.1 helix-turn-helix domain-containing protein [Chlorogloea sp. CCALA 695]
MTAAVKEKSELSLFVRREIDDYGLDPYEFRIYARITRRAGNGEAWESLTNMASACCMSLGRARRALHLLKLAKLVKSIERPGYSTVYRLTPQHKWVASECLQELRGFINLRAKSPTPIRSDRGTKNDSPITSSSTPLSEVIPLPLSEVIGEGIPSEDISHKVLPQSPLTPQGEKTGDGEKVKSNRQILELSQQLAQSITDALKPVFASFVTETKSVLSEIKERSFLADSQDKTKSLSRQRSKQAVPSMNRDLTSDSISYPIKAQEPCKLEGYSQFVEELARVLNEPVESLRSNSNLTNALNQNPSSIEQAMLYFKQALATWKKKPGLGLFISAVKKGLKPVPTKPGGGWGDWASEAMKRQLMQFSCSHEGDIMVYFANGIQKLWSEVKHLDWAELEAMVADSSNEACSA